MTKVEILHIANRRGKSCFDLIYEVYKELESRTCENCKWCKSGGEFNNDECHNTSLSGHLIIGTHVAADFCCNRWEKKDDN